MKKLKFILLFALSIAMLSCGSDDDGGSSGPELTAADLAGTYNLTFLESTTEIEETLSTGSTVTTTIEEVGDTFDDSNVVFSSNGTFTSDFQYRITITTTSTIENFETTEETEIESGSSSGTFSASEANETITIDGSIFDVTRFTNSELRLELNETFIDGNITETFTQELRFTRQ